MRSPSPTHIPSRFLNSFLQPTLPTLPTLFVALGLLAFAHSGRADSGVAVSANVNPALCDVPLARQIQALKSDVLTQTNFTVTAVTELITPVLQYAKENRARFFKYADHTSRRQLREDESRLILGLQDDLKQLYASDCIDRGAWIYYTAVSKHMWFKDSANLVMDKEIATWPTVRTYWIGRDTMDGILNSKHPDAENQKKIKDLSPVLQKLFSRNIKGIGRVSIEDDLLFNYTRPQINLIANVFIETLEMMSAQSGKIVLENARSEESIEIELSPSDIYRFSINYFDKELAILNYKEFRGRSLQLADSIIAAYLTGDVDPDALQALLTLKDFKEPKKKFLGDLMNTAWSATKVILYQHPVTMPFITLGSLLSEAIQRKKGYEKAESEKSFLIRR